jgi:hypothetical protein
MDQGGIRCGNCGATNAPDAQFCHNCGVLLAAYVSLADQQPPAEPTELAEAPAGLTEPPAATPPAEPAPPPPPNAPAETLGQAAGTASLSPTAAEFDEAVSSRSIDDLFGSLSAPRPVTPPEETAPPTVEPEPVAPVAPQPSDAVVFEPEPQPEPPAEPGPMTAQEILEEPATEQASARPAEPVVVEPIERPAPPAAAPTWEWSRATGSGSRINPAGLGRTPPQTLIWLGVALIFASCVLGPTSAGAHLPVFIAAPLWCAFPVGVVLLVMGVVQRLSGRSGRF